MPNFKSRSLLCPGRVKVVALNLSLSPNDGGGILKIRTVSAVEVCPVGVRRSDRTEGRVGGTLEHPARARSVVPISVLVELGSGTESLERSVRGTFSVRSLFLVLLKSSFTRGSSLFCPTALSWSHPSVFPTDVSPLHTRLSPSFCSSVGQLPFSKGPTPLSCTFLESQPRAN